ncbi:uncharacterized protein DAT39_001622, partial [Clarias magur]
LKILLTSFPEECLGGLHPAYIYCGISKVKENENVMFKCRTDVSEKTTATQIHVYLFKNSKIIRMEGFDARTSDDTWFNFTKVTVEHSGLYTCFYSEERLNISKTSVTGHNSISLEVLGGRKTLRQKRQKNIFYRAGREA